MPQIEVFCTISNCHYWDEGNRCGADRILITADAVSDRYPDEVDAQDLSMIVDEVGTTPASSGMDTCCKTFRPRD